MRRVAGPRAASTGIRAVDRAVQVLDLLAEAGQGLGVTGIARRLRLGKSTTHRLLSSLAKAEMVRLDPRTRVYHLGYRLLQWTSAWLDRMDVRTRALPHLRQLREKSQETVSLNLLEGPVRVAVERLEASQEVRFVAPPVRSIRDFAGEDPRLPQALFLLLLAEGVLTHPWHSFLSVAHTDADIVRIIEAHDRALGQIARALRGE